MPFPVELQPILKKELASSGLRYMLAMYWQGRADKIPDELLPLLEWITINALPADAVASWVKFQPGQTAFRNQYHQQLLDIAMEYSSSAQ